MTQVAIKMINKNHMMRRDELYRVSNEIAALQMLKHQNIMRLFHGPWHRRSLATPLGGPARWVLSVLSRPVVKHAIVLSASLVVGHLCLVLLVVHTIRT